jgi:CRP-like cAMP-binding protein
VIDPLSLALGLFLGAAIGAWAVRARLRAVRPVHLRSEQRRLHKLVFSAMTPAEMLSVLAIAEFAEAEDEAHLLVAGKAPNTVLLLVNGFLKVEVQGKAVGHLAAGRFAGEAGWVAGQPTAADVFADGPVRYVRWKRADLDQLFGRTPSLRSLFTVAVAQDLAAKLRFA